MSNSLQPHESQHARPPCPSLTPGIYTNSCPLSRWCHPTISSSVVPSAPTFSLSQHQGLFKWVSSSHEVAKVLEFQLQRQYFCVLRCMHFLSLYFCFIFFRNSPKRTLYLPCKSDYYWCYYLIWEFHWQVLVISSILLYVAFCFIFYHLKKLNFLYSFLKKLLPIYHCYKTLARFLMLYNTFLTLSYTQQFVPPHRYIAAHRPPPKTHL